MSPYFVISISIPPSPTYESSTEYDKASYHEAIPIIGPQWPGLKPFRGAEQNNISVNDMPQNRIFNLQALAAARAYLHIHQDDCVCTLGSSDRLVHLRTDTPLFLLSLHWWNLNTGTASSKHQGGVLIGAHPTRLMSGFNDVICYSSILAVAMLFREVPRGSVMAVPWFACICMHTCIYVINSTARFS